MTTVDEELGYDAASPSTPRAQAQRVLHPALNQPIPMQLDSSGPSSSNGHTDDNNVQDESSDISHQLTETDSKKEVWKKRKQFLLAEARNNTSADLQLHGLRPPEPHSSTYLGLNTQPSNALASTSNNSSTLTASQASTQSAILQWQDGNLRDDMLRLIDQFLEEEGMGATRQILAEEWTGKARERDEAEGDARKLKKAILGESRRIKMSPQLPFI